jgi:hypothetical protein
MPFDEQRQFDPPTGRSSASNTCDRNGGAQRARGSAASRSSARPDLVAGFGAPSFSTGFSTFPTKNRKLGPCPRSRPDCAQGSRDIHSY